MKSVKKAVRKAAVVHQKAKVKKQTLKPIKVTLESGNVLSVSGDVLALKYAQARHGADRGAAEKFRDAGRTLPKPKEWEAAKLVDSPRGIKAKQTLVVGTHHLWEYDPEFRYQFGYGDVRKLNAMFISGLIDHPVKSVVTTLHGQGVELDMFGVFDSALKGFQSAINRGQFPPSLERVSIVMKNDEHRNILQRRLEEILPNGIIKANAPITSVVMPRGSPDVFVAMSFHPKLDSVYSNISKGIHRVKWGDGRTLTSVRFDSNSPHLGPGPLLPQVFRNIRKAKFVIADLTPAPGDKLPRPNVCFEVGYARKVMSSQRILLVARKGTNVREDFSDLAGHIWTYYDTPSKLADIVYRKLTNMVKERE